MLQNDFLIAFFFVNVECKECQRVQICCQLVVALSGVEVGASVGEVVARAHFHEVHFVITQHHLLKVKCWHFEIIVF